MGHKHSRRLARRKGNQDSGGCSGLSTATEANVGEGAGRPVSSVDDGLAAMVAGGVGAA